MEWTTVVAIGALLLAGLTALRGAFNDSLSIREHDEYRKGNEKAMDLMRDGLRREIDKLETRMGHIEQTRPTTGELKGTADGVRDQLAEIKSRLKPD